ncbi:MAG: hypothetical protein HY671_04590 [Chloroflexi bacterium]|nr:hypothetical protein [Chloroflexota bacterium]
MELATSIQVPCTYFPKLGPSNTEETLAIARKRADELGIKTIVVATTKGDTALKTARFFSGYRVVIVTHAHGFRTRDEQEVSAETMAAVREAGGVVFTGTHTFAGLGRAVRKKYQTYQTEDLIASALRIFGAGMKVVCEIAMMAADAGLVRTDEDVISIAGSGRGADTAVVLRPVNTQDFFDLRVKEVLCKPHF